jgi:hypothetical protein
MAAAIVLGMLGPGTALAAARVLPGQASGVARDPIQSGAGSSTGQAGSHAAFATTPGRAGTRVSRLALNTRATGVDRGARISEVASGGMSQAGEHRSTAADQGGAGLDTAAAASGGASEDGLATARGACVAGGGGTSPRRAAHETKSYRLQPPGGMMATPWWLGRRSR